MTRRSLLPVLVVLLLQRCTAQEWCLRPENRTGVCINARNCPAVVELLLQRPLTTDIQNYLRSLQCGFEGIIPKVCCTQQEEPWVWSRVPPGTTSTETPRPQIETIDVPEPPNVSNHPNVQLINDNSCGPLAPRAVIVANKTDISQYPWMALLAYNTGSDAPEFECGGSLINKRYVITAAHCVTGLPSGTRLIGVRLGEHDLSTERDCVTDVQGLEIFCAERYQDFGLESVHFHPDYSRRLAQNDIALLRLNADADLRPWNVKPICLPVGFNSTLPSKTMVVMGWGTTESGRRSEVLLEAQLSIAGLAECAQVYRGRTQIWYKQLCAGGSKVTDSCTGDSGGPLQAVTFLQGHVKSVLFGIVSFGRHGCAIEGVPGVYTNVIYYMDWILNTIRS